jgi:hypothetical protein
MSRKRGFTIIEYSMLAIAVMFAIAFVWSGLSR